MITTLTIVLDAIMKDFKPTDLYVGTIVLDVLLVGVSVSIYFEGCK